MTTMLPGGSQPSLPPQSEPALRARSGGASRWTAPAWQTVYGLPGAVVAGIFLRVLLIGSKSIWLDEAMSLQVTQAGARGWLSGAAEAYHPPLYYAFLSLWIQLGQSETVLRLSSALFGVLAIPVAYLLARDLAGKGVARTTAWLVALSPLLVWYSQELRSYSLLVFLALLSSLALVRLLARSHAGWWLLYVVATAAAFYTHYAAILVVPIQACLFLAVLAQSRVSKSGAWLALAAWPVIIAAFWPWLSSPAASSFAGYAGATGGYAGMLLERVLGVSWAVGLLIVAAGAVLVTAFGLAAWVFIRRRGLWPRIYRSPWVRGAIFCAFVALIVLSVVPRGYSVKRLAVIAVPYLCLGAGWFWPLTGRLSKALGALLALSAIASLVNVVAVPKDDWRAAFTYVRSESRPGDLVLIAPSYDALPFMFYDRGPLIPVLGVDTAEAALNSPNEGTGRTWLVYNEVPAQVLTVGPEAEAALARTNRVVQERSAYRVRIVLFGPK